MLANDCFTLKTYPPRQSFNNSVLGYGKACEEGNRRFPNENFYVGNEIYPYRAGYIPIGRNKL